MKSSQQDKRLDLLERNQTVLVDVEVLHQLRRCPAPLLILLQTRADCEMSSKRKACSFADNVPGRQRGAASPAPVQMRTALSKTNPRASSAARARVLRRYLLDLCDVQVAVAVLVVPVERVAEGIRLHFLQQRNQGKPPSKNVQALLLPEIQKGRGCQKIRDVSDN